MKPLFYEREDKLECTTENLNFFLQALDERSQEYIWDYNDTGIVWGDWGVVMIYEAPYSTGANGFRTVNNTYNMRSLSLIRDHGRIQFDLMRENKETYVPYLSN